MMTVTGECFCGAVQYQVKGALFDARACHCSQCRRAFSGAGSTYALVPPGSFSWTAGEDNLSTYESMEGAGLQFCRICGSTLCGVFQGEVHGVTLGCVVGDVEVQIEKHLFVASKASWDHIGGDAPQFEEWGE